MANPNPVPPPEHSRWQPGKSPNPGGKPTGARNRVTGAFLNDLADVYAEKGKAALTKLVDDDPRTFFKALVALCPKQIDATVNPLEGLEDDTLMGFLHMLQSWRSSRAAQAQSSSEPVANGASPAPAGSSENPINGTGLS
jgi:hypothetical protein